MARILIVDDALLMRTIVKKELLPDGHEIVGEAKNGREAVEQYQKVKPDIVTMDITMEEKNGIDAAEEILSKDPDARIVMVTALGQEHLLSRAIRMGVKDFVVKPFDGDRIRAAITKALKD